MSKNEELITAIVFGFPAVMLILVLGLRRLILWLDDRGYIEYSGDPTPYGTLGSSFLELQTFTGPTQQYVLEAKDEEEQHLEEAGQAGPDHPTRHLGRNSSGNSNPEVK